MSMTPDLDTATSFITLQVQKLPLIIIDHVNDSNSNFVIQNLI